MVYKWNENFGDYRVSAQVAGEECDRIRVANNGLLTASALVDASRPATAPLHDEFEWDDSVAGERYREEQARSIIRCIRIVSELPDEEPKIIKLYHHLASSKAYEPIHVIMSDTAKKRELLESAKRDMKLFIDRYSTLEKLDVVFDVMNKTIALIEFQAREAI